MPASLIYYFNLLMNILVDTWDIQKLGSSGIWIQVLSQPKRESHTLRADLTFICEEVNLERLFKVQCKTL